MEANRKSNTGKNNATRHNHELRLNAKILKEKVKYCSKNIFENTPKQVFAGFIFLFYILSKTPPSHAESSFENENFISDILISAKSVICKGIPQKLNNAVDNIFIVAKSYPHPRETVGTTGGDIIKFNNHMVNFIKNQIGITDSVTIEDIVKNNEQLYRFLVDKRNSLNLSQQRSLENLSETDLCYLQELSAILVNYLKTRTPGGAAAELTEETPELRTVVATLYCFATEQDLKDSSAFFDSILLKVDINKHQAAFIKHIENVLYAQTTPEQQSKILQNE